GAIAARICPERKQVRERCGAAALEKKPGAAAPDIARIAHGQRAGTQGKCTAASVLSQGDVMRHRVSAASLLHASRAEIADNAIECRERAAAQVIAASASAIGAEGEQVVQGIGAAALDE